MGSFGQRRKGDALTPPSENDAKVIELIDDIENKQITLATLGILEWP
jgi:hypothetical protein